MSQMRTFALLCFLVLASTQALAQDAPTTIAELWDIIQSQQAEIDALKSKLEETTESTAAANQLSESIEQRFAETSQRIEGAEQMVAATADYVETLSAPKQRTTLTGYGELHYTNQSAEDADRDLQEVDFHRFVVFYGHEFTDRIRLFSEFELEHSLAGDGKPGEIEIEQAFINFTLNDTTNLISGLFLLPVGILNETHEPPSFYGVDRNWVENVIIPSTWWEAGIMLNGNLPNGLSWDVSIHSGMEMPTSGSSAYRVRSGRQKVAQAVASDLAYTFRLQYTGIPGVELSASYQHQNDPSQVSDDGLDGGDLFTTHAIVNRGKFGLRTLYAQWNFEGEAIETAGHDKQSGWYIEPSYRIHDQWGVFVRFDDVEGARVQDQFTEWRTGLSYWPTDNVAVKIDLRDRAHELQSATDRDFKALDLGIGYQF